jgi:NAD dependent epimerase/dehydratase family enzyme
MPIGILINKQSTGCYRKADHIIHLAGAGVADKRWTEKRKQEIVNSRTQSSALIVKALKEIPNKVKRL